MESAPAPSPLVQLTYVSAACTLFSAEDIRDILHVSRRNNARDAITGILVYKSGSVLQILEGEETVVRRLFAAIAQDKRHHQVNLLFVRPVAARAFSDWTMAFRRPEAGSAETPDGYSELLTPGFDLSRHGSEQTRGMLKLFVESIR